MNLEEKKFLIVFLVFSLLIFLGYKNAQAQEQQVAELTSQDCIKKDLDSCIAYMKHPFRRWKHIRTTNIIERGFKEVKRRVKVMETFPTEESCIRIFIVYLGCKMKIGRVSLSGIFKFTHMWRHYHENTIKSKQPINL